MDPNFLERLQKISLTEEETSDIAIRGSQRNQTLEECSLSVLGRFLSDKPLNLRAAKNLLRSIWKMGDDIKIIEVGEGLLQFKFSMESQLKWAVENGPWCFDDHLLVLKKWQKGMTAQNITFPTISLWVQVWGLPFELMNEETGKEIGGGLGKVLQVDAKAFHSEQARFLRVRVDIPLDKPLRRGAPVVSPEGDRAWVAFKYERIVGLCYACGRLGHEMRACPNTDQPATFSAKTETPYGEWMKAGSRRRAEESKNPPHEQPRKSRETDGGVMSRATSHLGVPTISEDTHKESAITPASVTENVVPQTTQVMKAEVNGSNGSSTNKEPTIHEELKSHKETDHMITSQEPIIIVDNNEAQETTQHVRVNLNNHATHVEGSMICEHASHVVTKPHSLKNHATHVEGSIISEHASHVVTKPYSQTKNTTWTRIARRPYREGMEHESETITKVGLKREWGESGVECKDATHGKEKRTRLDVGSPCPTTPTVEAAKQPRRSQ